MPLRALWLAGGMAVLASVVVWRERPVLDAAYERWRYPPAPSPGALARPIEAAYERERARRSMALYGQVMSELSRAKKEGFAVEGLKARADAAISLAGGPYRREALDELSRVELSIPRRGVQYIPLYPERKPAAAKGRTRKAGKARRGRP